ncbi:hypothetical protein CTAYLR_004025 [Chrysophaeum taylorii]|uniref:Uncharacterized protein n=1 Tax=Chrysophaeum taylorii TaxID=2483200 RepID=A0AAD7XIW4_9STRA|nr:hypothetical protein CTAYLR_004025 [Chrysophaeum taylorii]
MMEDDAPPLEAFVSEPGELKLASEPEHLEVRVICLEDKEDLEGLRVRIHARCEALTGAHAWRDPRGLCLERVDEGLVARFEVDGDDEWLAVAVFLDITARDPRIAARLTDGDGDFLLIDAAESLPDWLEPETSANRVWVRGGAVVVVLDAPGRLEEEDARQYLKAKSSRENEASSSATRAASRRIRFDRYAPWRDRSGFGPSDALAMVRRVSVPAAVATKLSHRRTLAKAASAAIRGVGKFRGEGKFRGGSMRSVFLRFSRAMFAELQYHSAGNIGSKLAAALATIDGPLDEAPVVLDEEEDDPDLDPLKLDEELEEVVATDDLAARVDAFLLHDDVDDLDPEAVLDALEGPLVHEEEEEEKTDELAGTHMAHSFQRRSEDGPLDLDFNLITSLLASLDAQGDAPDPGPADLLLSQGCVT